MPSTDDQALVLQDENLNKLVCALPGSGKTYTTVELADKILHSNDAHIIMVTFTNSAAKEMKERVLKRLGPKKAKRVLATTFAKIMLDQHKPLANGRKLII
jgi:superfamily I DNA/RNA helicase